MHDLSNYKLLIQQAGYKPEHSSLLFMRLQLIKLIKQTIKENKWTQKEAAEALGVAQPRIAEIIGLRVDKFSVELLAKYLHRLGKEVTLIVR